MPKRRANGEGNIRKRKDGRWEGRYTAGYGPESGKRLIKNVLGKTQAEVKEKLKAAISESQRLDVSKAGNYTVASWVRTWYEVYAEPRIRPNTKAYYANYIENHIIPGIGNISLDKLTTIQIQRFYNNLQKTGRVQRKNFPPLKDASLSPRVVRGVHTLLHNCLEQAVDLLIAEHQKHPRNQYLFPSPKTGTMYDPDAFRRTHDKILKVIGAEHIRFHDLRHPYVKHTTKIFSLRLMDFQAQAYPDARRKTRGACQLHRGGQSQSPVRPLCNRKQFS